MGYIDEVVKHKNMSNQERREKYQTFFAKTKPRLNSTVRIDLVRAMAFVGETNFSDEAQRKFIEDYNSFQNEEESPCVMVRFIEERHSRGAAYETYIVRMPTRGDKISEAKIDDGSIVTGRAIF